MQIEITSEYLASQGLSPTFADRFWAKVFIMPYDRGCWLWTASCGDKGYGQMGRWKLNDRPIGAHVASWILHFGPIPRGMCICHKCDNPPCVNPNHLFLGTRLDNTADMMKKGRHVIGKRYKGESHSNHIVTQVQVGYIRRLYESGARSQQSLADELGIAQTTVSAIIRRQTWA